MICDVTRMRDAQHVQNVYDNHCSSDISPSEGIRHYMTLHVARIQELQKEPTLI